ncbi:uncharacterized protein LOC110854037 [Folsomia candida]|uniref:uncharacterized protein LOC110854037 n=1 Tax=Folsomia candida TaxID=158441 RepID=UPI000B8F4ED4|nr:uncharacterized protein LOC110854037 [Folsomia candida]
MKVCPDFFVVVLSVLGLDLVVWGHVSLTFPPARQIPIDFLNTFWTKAPCGMPRGHLKTSLAAGKGFNVTWHLGYAHQGGYRLELLDQNENKLMDLTPTNDNTFHQGQTTAQSHYIDLPENSTCVGCTIRLLRQVPEFAPDFQFISCADVDIVSRQNFIENCNGHGYVIGGRCTCYARYWGDRCQYQDECDTDIDCNGQGRCIHLGGSALPRKQCYCPASHYGARCSLQNPTNMPHPDNLNLKQHVRVKLDERMTMYFKIFLGSTQSQDEMEFVLQINGTSYGGLGWRPTNIGPICKSWPFISSALHGNNYRTKRSSSSVFTITKSIDQTDNFSPSSQSHGRGQNYISTVSSSIDNSPQARQASSSVYQSFDTITTNSDSGVQNAYRAPVSNNNIQTVIQSSTPSRLRLQQNSQNIQVHTIQLTTPRGPQVQSLPLPRAQPVVVSSSSSSSQQRSKPQQQQQQNPAPQQTSISQPSFTPSEWAAKDPFTPMDCSDIIVGSARGNYHRIRDTYSRGRHTPLPDYIWGGRDDLIGAVGWEQYGVTTLAFRRRMDAADGPDHPIRGDMQVIWARGQEPGEVVPVPQHQLTPGNPTVSSFYTRDELKYHGLGSQRGFLFIDFDAVRQEFVNGRFSQ